MNVVGLLACCCLATLCVIVQAAAFPAQKRIFCNFDGCHNKRSGSRSPNDNLLTDLLSSNKQDSDYVGVSDQSLEKILDNDSGFGAGWRDIPKGNPDDVVISPRLIGALIRRLDDLDRRGRVNSAFDN